MVKVRKSRLAIVVTAVAALFLVPAIAQAAPVKVDTGGDHTCAGEKTTAANPTRPGTSSRPSPPATTTRVES